MVDSKWALRSHIEKSGKYKGVLFKGFPGIINNYIHNWEIELIINTIKEENRKRSSILDIGCGYGRITNELEKKFPGSRFTGLDISSQYVKQYVSYNPRKRKGITADFEKMKLKKDNYSIIIDVAALMYISTKQKFNAVLNELIDCLQVNGTLILIENNIIGRQIYTLFGILPAVIKLFAKQRIKVQFDIKGLLFHYNEIDNMLIRNSRIIIKQKTGFPIFTLLLPLNSLIALISKKFAAKILYLTYRLDKKLQILNIFSLYHFYVINKIKE